MMGILNWSRTSFMMYRVLLKNTTKMSMIMAVASPMDEHGYFSLGTGADYVAEFIGHVPFILEVNEHMPRTFGREPSSH